MLKVLSFLTFIAISAKSHSMEIKTTCINKASPFSRGSVYQLNLDTNLNNGTLRYKFMDQDVIYKVYIEQDRNFINGIAHFSQSYSGERKGSSFKFNIDLSKKIFKEGVITANCK